VTRAEANTLLAPIALERARVLAPFVLAAMIGALLSSESAGIPLSPLVVAFNVVSFVLFGAATVLLAFRRIADRWGHVVISLMWWGPVAGTLMSLYSSHGMKLALVLMLEIGGSAIVLHTGWLLASFALLTALWLPLAARDGGPEALVYIATIVVAQVFATLWHVLMRRSLVQAEVLRRSAQDKLAELQRSEHERTQLHDQLLHAQRMEAAGTLAAGLAHDMNNVLASITTFSELLREELHDPAHRADLEQIISQADRGAELTRALLAFSRRGQYRKQVLRIGDVLRDVVPLLERTLPKTIAIETALDVADTCVEGDDVQLTQSMVNFALNAADAMAGAGTLTISADVVTADTAAGGLAPGRHVRIRVADTGAGMDDVTRRRVFEPFFTTKPVGKGTGLGLSTVWGIIQAHQGAVDVESEVGRGSTFTMRLPVSAQPVAAPRPRSGPVSKQHGTVLLIDDEPAVRSAIGRLLQREGLEVLTAGDGAEGLRVYDQHAAEIGLVVLDMGMPVMGGAECFRELRVRGEVPVLVMTGYAVETEAQTLVARGAALLEKPAPSADVLREVMRLLRRGHRRPSSSEREGGPYDGEVGKPSSV
jgi:signal transduction histidine kinase/ActR/RegA family two-component response regulator